MLHHLLLPYIYNECTNSSSLLDAVRDPEILNYIELGYSSFFSANTSATSLLFDALIASDEASFASYETKETRIHWVDNKSAAVPHLVLGSSPNPGGQWSSGNTPDDSDEKSLSYAEMLSLPGLSFTEFFVNLKHPVDGLSSFSRPKRKDIAEYYDEYAKQLNLLSSFKLSTIVTSVEVSHDSSSFAPMYTVNFLDTVTNTTHSLETKVIVLASGVFEKPLKNLAKAQAGKVSSQQDLQNNNESIAKAHEHLRYSPFMNDPHIPIITPPENFCDVTSMEPSIIVPRLPLPPSASQTIIILGSGVSAAEAVNQCSKHSGVNTIHIYRWHDDDPGPLRRFSKETYPEYARVYRLMRRFSKTAKDSVKPDFFSESSTYEGLPNSMILEMSPTGKVTIQLQTGERIVRNVAQIKVCTGRSGSLAYLSPSVCKVVGFSSECQLNTCTDRINLNAVSKTSMQPYILSSKTNSYETLSQATMAASPDALCPVSTTSTISCCDAQSVTSTTESTVSSAASSVLGFNDSYQEDCKDVPGYSLRLGPGMYAIGSLTGETLVRLMLGGCAWVAGDIFKRRSEISG